MWGTWKTNWTNYEPRSQHRKLDNASLLFSPRPGSQSKSQSALFSCRLTPYTEETGLQPPVRLSGEVCLRSLTTRCAETCRWSRSTVHQTFGQTQLCFPVGSPGTCICLQCLKCGFLVVRSPQFRLPSLSSLISIVSPVNDLWAVVGTW